jgi:hypothetical protein
MLKLTFIISFTSPNSVFLIHHEFEGVLDVYLVFSIFIFLQGFFIYFRHHTNPSSPPFPGKMFSNTRVLEASIPLFAFVGYP